VKLIQKDDILICPECENKYSLSENKLKSLN